MTFYRDGGIEWESLNYTLTIRPAENPESGYTSGQMKNYSNIVRPQWYTHQVRYIVFEEGVTHIGGFMANSNSNLLTVSFPSTLKSIGDEAFSLCEYYTGPLTLPDSLVTIGESAFASCTRLTGKITLGTSLDVISMYAFQGCPNVSGVVSKGNKPTTLAFRAFNLIGSFTSTKVYSFESSWADASIIDSRIGGDTKWTFSPLPVGNTIYVKINDNWKQGTPYVKIDGVWKQGAPSIKVDGVWK